MHLIPSIAWFAAGICALVMGASIQRGATCLVAAVGELVQARSASRLRSLLEAALWVAAGLALLQMLQLAPARPASPAFTAWTVPGAVLLGLGAWVNRSCVFGTIARLGNGEWAYAASPLGFYAGCVGAAALLPPQAMRAGASPAPDAPLVLLAAFAAMLAMRLVRARAQPSGGWWTPHTATIAIGLTFLAMLLLVGAWAYTDVLAEAARAMMGMPVKHLGARLALGACLFAGAAFGGWRAGRWRPTMPTAAALARCLAGGALMGAGSLLIPGGNDGLILLGLPLLWPVAWAAVAVMGGSIAAAQVAAARWQRG